MKRKKKSFRLVTLFLVFTIIISLNLTVIFAEVAGASPTFTITKIAKKLVDGISTIVTDVDSGEEFYYEINYSVSGLGDENVSNVIIEDILPPEVKYVKAEGSSHTKDVSYNEPSRTVTIQFKDDFTSGSSGAIKIYVKFPNGTTPDGTQALNNATFSSDNSGAVTSNEVISNRSCCG